ncbi:MAG: EAL domain-containing response regulator [Myxococcales bacterium]|nr:EAL domain-containing response regulator [Myxococcales bacterium]
MDDPNTHSRFGQHAVDPTARVLVVDDDERTRAAMGAVLRTPGVELDFAVSGAEALLRAREWHPDVVLLDVMMPGIDGFEVCRRLRADPEIGDVRVLMVTSLDDSSSRLQGFEAGADDFLTKPINRSEMIARVKGVARLNRFRALVEQQRRLVALEHSYAAPTQLPMMTEAELKVAFRRALQSLRLVYHPIVSVDSGRGAATPIAHEALMRVADPDLPHVLAVIAAAAVLGKHIELGRVVRARAAEVLATLPEDALLFVNMGPHELLDECLYDGTDALAPFASRVVFELTERESLEEIRGIRERLRLLRTIGFRFAIDDLGGGYSSLNSFPVVEPEFVKLDRSLIRGIATEPIRETIVRTMVSLCVELGITMIVEGVETREEQLTLARLGCRYQQGWVYGRPTDAHPSATGSVPAVAAKGEA